MINAIWTANLHSFELLYISIDSSLRLFDIRLLMIEPHYVFENFWSQFVIMQQSLDVRRCGLEHGGSLDVRLFTEFYERL